MNIRTLVVTCAIGAVSLGCGRTEPPEASSATSAPDAAASAEPGPCDLLTAEDVRAILAEPVEPGVPTGYECAYSRPPNEQGLRVTAVRLRLEFGDSSPHELLGRYQTTLRNALGQYDPVAVSGVGDAAAWDGDGFATTVSLGRGRSAFVNIQLQEVDRNLERDLARRLAAAAVARLRR